MNGKAMVIGGTAIIALALSGGLVLRTTHGHVSTPTGETVAPVASPADLARKLVGIQIAPPDDQFQPGPPMICTPSVGDIALHCVQTFNDNARFGQTDYVMVYVLNKPGSLAALQAEVDRNLASLGEKGLISATETDTISGKSGNGVFNSDVKCEQAMNDAMYSYAVCLAPDIGNTAVATAIFPDTWSNVTNVSHPPDILRAEALESQSLVTVYEALTPAPN